MSVKRDYYEVLGVKKTATQQEIEQSYRKLAVENHPDRAPEEKKEEARQKFKELSEAYAVLSDTKKRAQYDSYGHAGIDQRYRQEDIFRNTDFGSVFEDMGFGSGTFADVFSDLFSGGSSRSRYAPRGGDDIEFPIKITLEEAFNGTEKNVSFYHTITCNVCNGSGAKPGTGTKTCQSCRGAGQVRYSQGFFVVSQPCPKCSGQGKIIDTPCGQCTGRGKVKEQTKIMVKVPRGVDTGTSIRMRGKGEAGELGGPPGDLYVTVRIEPHKIFARRGDDLFIKIPVSFVRAALGGELLVPTLSGQVTMKIPPGTQPGKTFRLRGHGTPNLHSHETGMLYVTVDIEVPTKLNEKQKQLLREFAQNSGENVDDEDSSFFKRVFRT
ncbi:MAG: molecular chaperone DnaJ [Elusimicrobiota bacterium]